jgi:hypothetical protein
MPALAGVDVEAPIRELVARRRKCGAGLSLQLPAVMMPRFALLDAMS